MKTPKKNTLLYKVILSILVFLCVQSEIFASTIYGISYKNSNNILHTIDASTGESNSSSTFSFSGAKWIGNAAVIKSSNKLYTANNEGLLYEFDLTNGSSVTKDMGKVVHSIVSDVDNLYVISERTLYSVDTSDGNLSSIGALNSEIGSVVIIRSEGKSKLYFHSSEGKLHEFDLSTKTITKINQMNINMQTIFAGTQNKLYGIKANKLYSINTDTGIATSISTLSFGNKFWARTVSINDTENRLYMVSQNSNEIYTFNLTTGALIQKKALYNSLDSSHTMQSLHVVDSSSSPTNSAPTGINLTSTNILENQASGTVVGTLSATDPNSGDVHTFSLGCTGVDNGSFTIDGTLLKSAAVFDYETKKSYSICIRTSDGTLSFDKNFDINITNSNEAPTSSNKTFTINEDETKTFAASDFDFSDVDVGDNLHSIVISSLETAGSLKLNGIDVTSGQTITTINIPNLKFTPATNASGSPYASFGFKVNDSVVNSIEYTVTINVNPVDDKPILDPLDDVLKERNFGTFYVPLNASDAENHTIDFNVTSTNNDLAIVSISGNQVQIISKADVSGSSTITVTAKANNLTDVQSFVLTVNSKLLIDINNTTMDEDSVLKFNLSDIIKDPENNTSVEVNASSDNTDLATVLVDDGVLTIAAVTDQTGDFNLTVNANDGFYIVSKTVVITVKEVTDDTGGGGTDNNGTFWEDENVQSNRKAEFTFKGKKFIAYSDLKNGGKLTIAKEVNGTWEDITGLIGMGDVVTTDIVADDTSSSKKVFIHYNGIKKILKSGDLL